jgi:hypothetical protein
MNIEGIEILATAQDKNVHTQCNKRRREGTVKEMDGE